MVAMIDRLAKAGFIERVASETDRRIKHIRLTGTGEGVYAEIRAKATEFREDILCHVAPDELSIMTSTLEKIQKLIETS